MSIAENDALAVRMPDTDEAIEALHARGYMPAVPPQDYAGSIADWCGAMADRGLPSDYTELCDWMIQSDAWEAVLEQCEAK